MRQQLHRLLFKVLITAASVSPLAAQSNINELISAPQGTPVIPVRFGSVNLNTGNLQLDIPLISMKERGGAPSTMSLRYNSMFWQGLTVNNNGVPGSTVYPPNQSYWSPLVNSGAEVTGSVYPVNPGPQSCGSGWFGTIYFYNTWTLIDSNGTAHNFSPGTTSTQNCSSATGVPEYPNGYGNQTASGPALDGSGFFISITNGNSATIFRPDGSQAGSTPNGNEAYIGSNPQVAGGVGPGTDALPATSSCPRASSQPYSAQASQTCQLTYRPLNGASGAVIAYTLVYEYVPVCTGFYSTQPPILQAYDYCGGIWAVKSLTLPDGVSIYTFAYDTGTVPGHYGQLTSVTLPTGGTISYTYYPPTGIGTSYLSDVRGDIQSISDNGATTNFTRTFCGKTGYCAVSFLTAAVTSPPHAPDPLQPTATVQDQTVYSTSTSAPVGSVTPTMLTEQDYLNGVLITTKTQDTTVLGIPAYSQTTWNQTGATDRIQYSYTTGDVVSRADEYLNGYLYRSLVKQYQQDTSTIKYVSQYHMVNYPVLTQIIDGSGNLVAQEARTYDEYGATYCNVTPPGVSAIPMLTNITGAIGHDDVNFGNSRWARGNPTAISTSTSATASITTHNCYDTLGNVTEAIDGNGHPTSFSYVDNFTDTNCILSSTKTYALPTLITDALGHQTKLSYNSCMRAPVQQQDANDLANGRSGTRFSYDTGGRPLCTSYSDGGQVCNSYQSPTVSTVAQLVTGSNWHSVATTLNPFGYPSSALDQITNAEVDKTYDTAGRLSSVSNPYTHGGSASPAFTSYGYDGFGRTLAVLSPDGSEQHSAYTGQTLDGYDESGVHHQLVSDSLGRLVKAFELGTSGAPLNLETDYSYDVLNNLKRVDQWGGPSGTSGERARTFSYDWASRLTLTQNPENGITCYGTVPAGSVPSLTNCSSNGYDGAGNLSYKTDARGITTSFVYDALNRLRSKAYNDSTPSVSLNYDESGDWAAAACGGTGFVQCNTKGRLSSMNTSNNTGSVFGYDPMGRIIMKSSCVGSICDHNRIDQFFAYDLAGNETGYDHGTLVGSSYFGGHGMSYDTAGRLQTLTYSPTTSATPSTLFSATTFGPIGLLDSKLGNGLTETRSYDGRARQSSYNALTTVQASPTSTLSGYLDVAENNDVVRFPNQTIVGSSLPENGEIYVAGWVGTAQSCPVAAVEIDIDKTPTGYGTLGFSRPDVQQIVYASDGAHQNCGYHFTGSIGAASIGSHTVSAYGIDADGNRLALVGSGLSITVTSDPPPSVSFGLSNTSLVSGGLLTLTGWAIDSQMHAPVGSVKILIDGQPVGYATLNVSRPDVANYFGDARYTNSGITYSGGIGGLAVGTHTASVIAYDSGGQSVTAPTQSFSVVADTSGAGGVFDTVANSTNQTAVIPMGGTIAATGWAGETANTTACASTISRVDILLDGNYLGQAKLGIARTDVVSAYQNSSCLNSGWKFTGTVSNVDPGLHVFTARAYDPSGGSVPLGNAVGTIQVNAQLSPASVASALPSQYAWSLGFEPNSNVGYSYDLVNGGYSYLYDNLNRLAAAGSDVNALEWTYDSFGNRTAQIVTQGSGVNVYQTFSSNTNRPDGQLFDAAGNASNTGGAAPVGLSYDAEGRISAAGSTSYIYDAMGQRVAKYVGGSMTNAYLYDNSGHVVTELNGSFAINRREVYAGSRHLGTFDQNGNLTYVLADWVGTERARATSAGTLCQTTTSQPFGDNQQTSGICFPSPAFFTGKERDAESGLDYFGARYYSSSMGRFSSPDPSGLAYADMTNPQSLNLYSYVLNNPLINIDPSGMECVWDDGSFDPAEDPDTGNPDACSGKGGTYVIPDLFENALLTNGQYANYQRGDWSADANSTLQQSWVGQSPTVSAGPGMPLTGNFGPQDIGNLTLTQFIDSMQTVGVNISPVDNLLYTLSGSKVGHPGTNMRDSSAHCSLHLNVDPGTGVNGVPVSGSFHFDEYNPYTFDPPPSGGPIDVNGGGLQPIPNLPGHVTQDVIPDMKNGNGPGWTGNQNCFRK